MLREFTKYYYTALPEEKKRIYKALYDGFAKRERSVEIVADTNKISPKDVSDIAISVYNDTPSFYYLDMSGYSYITTPQGYIYSQKYLYSERQIEDFDRRLSEGIEIFASKYIRAGMTDYEKEKVIHDYLVNHVEYDHDAFGSTERVGEAFNVLGALIKGRAVCWGISCAFKLLCDCFEIKSMVVTGELVPKEGEDGHAWNMVKLGGETFHVDVTWDIKEKGDISFCYDYFNLDDALISPDHRWDRAAYPCCNSVSHNYYYKNRLYVKDLNGLSLYITDRLRAGERYIALKYANDMPPKEEVEAAIEKAFRRSFRFASYRYYISESSHNIYIECI